MYNVSTSFPPWVIGLGLEAFLNFTDLNLYLQNPPKSKYP